MNYSNLLLGEPPLQVLPTLAKLVGLNEAIILQQLHYWLQKSNNVHGGRTWVYNSYKQWQEQFPFWKPHTIQRAFTDLERRGLVIAKKLEAKSCNHRKWYSIDYEALKKFYEKSVSESAA